MDLNLSPDLRDQLASVPTLRLVAVAGHVVSQRFGRIFGEQDGLSPTGAAVLGMVGRDAAHGDKPNATGRVTHAELARRCLITPATLTGVVNTLVKAGYLERERDQADRRVVWLTLTDAGTERVGQLHSQIKRLASPVSRSIPAEHEEIIRQFLVDLVCRFTTPEDGLASGSAAPALDGHHDPACGPPSSPPSGCLTAPVSAISVDGARLR